eukprot:520652_1
MDDMCSLTNVHGIQNDNDKTLRWVRKPNMTDEEFEKAPGRCKRTDAKNILRGFNAAHIQYKIIWSRHSQSKENNSKYIYVVIWIDEKETEKYADYQDLSVLINCEESIKAGRLFPEFHLAHRTYVASIDEESQIPINASDDKKRKRSSSCDRNIPYVEMLGADCWDNIHIPFESSILHADDVHNIYSLYPAANNPSYQTVVHHRLYLRILHSILIDDRSMKGADFQADYYLLDATNPFVAVFALHDFDNELFYPTRNPWVPRFAFGLFECNWRLGWITNDGFTKLNDNIREYFGEYIAFYYAFLSHYILWLLPMVVFGLIWFGIQLVSGTIAVAGSALYVLLCVVWSTVMIEVWYRRESALRFKWGMCRHRETEVPRPTFKGKVKISKYNGDIIEDHANLCKYWCKITLSLSTMVLCIAVVIAVVGSIWILKRRWRDNPEYKMAIGVINAIQIKIFNVLYTKLAYALNDFEQHRLQEDYVNHLVVKRIIFMVVNSFNSLFYMAFYDDSYVDNEDRLNSLRIQLFTLFVTSIVLLNLLEILFPKIPKWIRKYKESKEEKSAREEEWNEAQFTGGLDTIIIKDIESQILRPKLPSTLDNVAEIVILQGYIIVFAVVLPIMPLLAYLNAILEIRIDVYNLTGAQRPCPRGADGIGVWKAVLTIFNTCAIFSNMAVIAWITDLPQKTWGLQEVGRIVWYFVICISMLVAMIVIRMAFPDESRTTKQAMARQAHCENLVNLLMDSSPDANK